MRYTPSKCPKCGTEPEPKPKGGRPTRWCSDGCRTAGEAEMARLQRLLVKFEEGHYVHLLNYDDASARRLKVLAEMQARYDHLAGVPQRAAMTDDERRLVDAFLYGLTLLKIEDDGLAMEKATA